MSQKFLGFLRKNRLVELLFLTLLSGGVIRCGYGFQNSRNPLYLTEGIQAIYVAPLVNNTYKAGVENTVYNNLIRILASHGKVTLVQNPKEADATLKGVVQIASYGSGAAAIVSGLKPIQVATHLPTSGFYVSTVYSANLSCNFALERVRPQLKKKNLVWTGTFTKTKPFPSANQVDIPGTTSALINDSEFDRALSDLARSMMDDVHESMVALF